MMPSRWPTPVRQRHPVGRTSIELLQFSLKGRDVLIDGQVGGGIVEAQHHEAVGLQQLAFDLDPEGRGVRCTLSTAAVIGCQRRSGLPSKPSVHTMLINGGPGTGETRCNPSRGVGLRDLRPNIPPTESW